MVYFKSVRTRSYLTRSCYTENNSRPRVRKQTECRYVFYVLVWSAYCLIIDELKKIKKCFMTVKRTEFLHKRTAFLQIYICKKAVLVRKDASFLRKNTCFFINIYFVKMMIFYVKVLHPKVKRQLF